MTSIINKKDYYIYFHICQSTGRTFYIGKGRGNRARELKSRNDKWHSYVFNNGYDIYIYKNGLTEEDALKLEEELILIHKDHGFLVNVVGVDTPPYSVQKELSNIKRQNQILQEQLKLIKQKKVMTLEEFEEKHKELIALGAVTVVRPESSSWINRFIEICIDRYVPPNEGERCGTFLCDRNRLLSPYQDVRKMGFQNDGDGVYIKETNNSYENSY